MSCAVSAQTRVVGFSSSMRAARSQQKRAAAAPLRAAHSTAAKRRVLVVYAATRGAGPVAAAASDGEKTNVLVVGGGGREHSLCWRLRQSPTCANLFCTPGNAGIVAEEGVQTVDVKETDHAAVIAFCKENDIGE
jgi:phosphoribosylamine--glycine ligase